MLSLKGVTKKYILGVTEINALKGIDIEFRKNEFVSILGPSGCGKTTLLNIIGGLDQYTEGDLIINGKSTKDFTDSDWDSYRNHSIGFVFQNYNLIPHQTVLSNVELALTLSGVSKSERRQRAISALEKVGLKDQLNKKPNQMSGGQMQRVAIARALVNNPDILLADEPTGALDSETSVQIMEILKEISKDKLIIMVTHNPDLADQYSSRIVKLLDGLIIDDSNPYNANIVQPIKPPAEKSSKVKTPKTSMSFFTALSLSLNNLMTKKARTFLTSFAGSIGIIGIALILAISSGAQSYITRVEEDTLSSYPITIEKSTIDLNGLLSSVMSSNTDNEEHGTDKVYSNDIMSEMLKTMMSEISVNNMKDFKEFIESGKTDLSEYTSDIKYGYSTVMNIYKEDSMEEIIKVNPSTVFEELGFMQSGASSSETSSLFTSGAFDMNVWKELTGNTELLKSQYDIVSGRLPESYDEAVIVTDKDNEISDFTLYSLGLKDIDELKQMLKDISDGKEVELTQSEYTYEELLGLKFRLVTNTDYFEKNADGLWEDKSQDTEYLKNIIENGTEIKIVGILCPAEGAVTSSSGGFVGYTSDLMEHLINRVNDSEIVKEQKANPEKDIFTGKPFSTGEDIDYSTFDPSVLSPEQQAYFATLNEEEKEAAIQKYFSSLSSESTYEANLEILGVSDLNNPSTIYIYPRDFEAKEKISDIINDYNEGVEEEYKIQYTDYIGLMMSSVTTIINAISYILIAFVAISLIVSSIMIGIITYISVLERTKEIGILRSIGASKKDISRVFNAETLIVGFAAGAIGIGLTLILTIPVNIIIDSVSGIGWIVALPVAGGVILVAISMLLTFIAGLIPAKIAAKKDPVVALRTE